MPFEKIQAARSWMLGVKINKTRKKEMETHLDTLERAVRNNQEQLKTRGTVPRDDALDELIQAARDWGKFHNLDASNRASLFFSHLDAIRFSYREMVRKAAEAKKRAK